MREHGKSPPTAARSAGQSPLYLMDSNITMLGAGAIAS